MIKIANQSVGKDSDVFIIAEAGVNHNGRLNLAFKLIDAAAEAGAQAVKFQTFKPGQVVVQNADMAAYQKRNTASTQSQFSLLKKLELKERFYLPIIKHCQKRKILFLSTPHGGFESIDFLQQLHMPAFKFGSGDLDNFPVLEYAAKLGKPMIISTGMATLAEVKQAISCIKKTGNKNIIVLHATTNYPCPIEEVNLLSMLTMMNTLQLPIGYSDHTLGIDVAYAAVVLGACVIEKHFTLDKTLPGPDHRCSSEPSELKAMVERIKSIKKIMGSPIKKPNYSELNMIKSVRKSLVSTQTINKGDIFTSYNIGIKRPGTGLRPRYYKDLLGKKSRRKILKDTMLTKLDYASRS